MSSRQLGASAYCRLRGLVDSAVLFAGVTACMVTSSPCEALELRLPYPDGVSYQATQGNHDTPTHSGPSTQYDIDFAHPSPPSSSTVVAAASGTAHVFVWSGNRDAEPFGNQVKVDHGNGLFTLYAHLKPGSFAVANDTWVQQGRPLGEMGNTGKVYSFGGGGYHIHFGLHRGDATQVKVGTSVAIDHLVANDVTSGSGYRAFRGEEIVAGLNSGHRYLSDNSQTSSLACVLVLDISGSMGDAMLNGQRKVDALKSAVRGFLKTIDDDVRFSNAAHRIGAITFSDQPTKLCDFTSATDDVRRAVDRLEPQEATNFGDSLEMAVSMLEQASGDKKTLLFFSDGKTNRGPIPRDDFVVDFDPSSSPRSDIFRDKQVRDLYYRAHQANIRIITVGFGDPGRSSSIQKYIWLPDADPDLDDEVLRKLAETPQTGGRYVNAQDYTGLLKSFVVAYNVGSGRQLVYETTGTIARGETLQISFDPSVVSMQTSAESWLKQIASFDILCSPAEADEAGQLLVTLGWDVGRLALTLLDPTGVAVTPSYPGAHVSSDASPINIFVDNPKRGKWSATVAVMDAPGATVDYYFLASSKLPPLMGGGYGGAETDWQDTALALILSCIVLIAILIMVTAVRRRQNMGVTRSLAVGMLRLLVPGQPPRNLVFDGPVVSLGRDPHNTIVLSDPKVSGRHAELRIRGGQAVVVDINSTNGTWVNGRRVRSAAVRQGDRIRIGDATVTLGARGKQ